MHCGKRKPIEDCTTQPTSEALRRVCWQAEVLVHVKRGYPRPIDIFLAAKRRQHLSLARRRGKNHADAGLFAKKCANLIGDVGCSLTAHGDTRLRHLNDYAIHRWTFQ